jgi:hypothetical protein
MDDSCVNGGMLNLRQHRVCALLLSFALLLSSAGLPVIVVACAMGKTVRATGCAGSCRSADVNTRRITRIPCRAEYHFIERNTTAYVPARHVGEQPPLQILMVVPASHATAGSFASVSCIPTSSPPAMRDIPIFTSSLLI